MRVAFVLPAGLLVVLWAAASALSAPPDQSKNVSPPPASVVELERGISPHDIRLSTPLSGASAMSADDCSAVGGHVVNDTVGLCASKKICMRRDNEGVNHAVCLDAKQ